MKNYFVKQFSHIKFQTCVTEQLNVTVDYKCILR